MGEAGRFGSRGTAGKLADGGISRTAGQRDAQNDVAGPGLRLCSRYGMRPCRLSELGTLGTQMPSTLVPQYVPCQAWVGVGVGSVRRASNLACLLRATPYRVQNILGAQRGRNGNNSKEGIPSFVAPNNNTFLLPSPISTDRKEVHVNQMQLRPSTNEVLIADSADSADCAEYQWILASRRLTLTAFVQYNKQYSRCPWSRQIS